MLQVLAYRRKGETFADVAAGFGVGTATAWRYAARPEQAPLLPLASRELAKAIHVLEIREANAG